MPHLLQIHIGPVQEFIAAARRSRDLWYGSWLLSELSKAAAYKIADQEATGVAALVFPAPPVIDDLKPDSPLNVANKIVAEINGTPKEVAGAARTAVCDRLHDLRKLAFPDFLHSKLKTWAVTKDQIDDFLEFYWVALPIDGDYQSAREDADSFLAARKSTRDFKKVTWGSSVPKSSLDGSRESVIPKGMIGDAQEMYKYFRAKANEELSGVDLLKRRGVAGKQEYFPSTSHMAALPLQKQLKALGVSSEWDAYLELVSDDAKKYERVYHELKLPLLEDYDGSLLFASRLLDYMDKEELPAAEKALDKFFKKSKIDPPNPYYAVLIGDGDFMGRTINRLVSAEDNRQFSRALAGFASRARKILGEHQGAPIFTGGDDVQALLPLHTALPCAAELAAEFRSCMAEYDNGKHGPPTFSAGIAIVHHLEPLEDALQHARDAEKAAKAFPDKANPQKNALAVTLVKRSGAPRQVVGKWNIIDKRLLKLAALHQKEAIPDGLAYQLRDTYLALGGRKAVADSADLREVMKLEAERIIGRKQEGGGEGIAAAHKAYLMAAVQDSHTSAASVADELIIAGELAKAAEIARIDLLSADEIKGGAA